MAMSTNRTWVRSPDTVGILMYLVAAFLFAFNGSIAKLAMAAGLDAMHLTQLRNAGAMAVLVENATLNPTPAAIDGQGRRHGRKSAGRPFGGIREDDFCGPAGRATICGRFRSVGISRPSGTAWRRRLVRSMAPHC